MGPTWGPSGADRTQVGPVLVPWTLLSGMLSHFVQWESIADYQAKISTISNKLWNILRRNKIMCKWKLKEKSSSLWPSIHPLRPGNSSIIITIIILICHECHCHHCFLFSSSYSSSSLVIPILIHADLVLGMKFIVVFSKPFGLRARWLHSFLYCESILQSSDKNTNKANH